MKCFFLPGEIKQKNVLFYGYIRYILKMCVEHKKT